MSATPVRQRYQRLQRSELAVPATSEKFFAKAASCAADAIFLDLEDAVADGKKIEARQMAIHALNNVDWGNKAVSVRVNGLDTIWGQRDILEIAAQCPRLDMILLPKAGTGFDIAFVDQLLTGVEREHPDRKRLGLEALIETAQGVAHAEEIAAASERLEAIIFGVGDYTVDMRTYDAVFGLPSSNYAVLTSPDQTGQRARHWNDQWHFALARIANACRSNGLRAIDGPYTAFGDPEGYRASALRGLALGFEGKWAIHPSQVDLANEVYSPSRAQLDWAGEIRAEIEAASESGHGAFQSKGILIDLAHRKLADSLLSRAETIRRFEKGGRS